MILPSVATAIIRNRLQQPMSGVLALVFALLSCFALNPSHAQPQAPDFSLPDIYQGDTVHLQQYFGKVIYVDFWASWCPPCRQSLPLLNELRQRIGSERFEILAINLDENPQDGLRFLQKYPVDYPVLADPQGKTPEAFKLTGMPMSYLLDQQLRIVGVHEGFKKSDIKKIHQAVTSLLAQQP